MGNNAYGAHARRCGRENLARLCGLRAAVASPTDAAARGDQPPPGGTPRPTTDPDEIARSRSPRTGLSGHHTDEAIARGRKGAPALPPRTGRGQQAGAPRLG